MHVVLSQSGHNLVVTTKGAGTHTHGELLLINTYRYDAAEAHWYVNTEVDQMRKIRNKEGYKLGKLRRPRPSLLCILLI